MKKFILAFLLTMWAGYACATSTVMGDGNIQLSPTDDFVKTRTVFTAPHTLTIPAASSVSNQSIRFFDVAGAISSINPLTVVTADGSLINGQASFIVNSANANFTIVPGNNGYFLTTTGSGPCNNNAMAKLGDSRLAQEYAAIGQLQYTKGGYNFLTIANELLGQRMQTQYLNFAVSGLRSDQYLAAQYTSQAFASNACWLMIYGIVNDASLTGATVDYWNTYIKPVVQQWIAQPGRKVLLPTETGSTTVAATPAGIGAVVKYNRQIRAFAAQYPAQVYIVDIAGAVMDPTQAMAFKSGYSSDGTHCNTMPCGFAAAQVLVNTINSAGGMPTTQPLMNTAGEAIANNPLASTSTLSTIAGTTMTYGGTITGACLPGMSISGSGIGTFNSTIVSGPTSGGAGTYTLSASYTISTPQVINCGPGPVQLFGNPLWLTTTGGVTNASINSGGAVPAGITAWTVPGGWTATVSAAAGATYGNDLTVTITASSAGSLVLWAGYSNGATAPFISPGRGIYANCEYDVAGGATNFQSVSLWVQHTTNVNATSAYDGYAPGTAAFGNMPTPQTGLTLQTPLANPFTGTSQTSMQGQIIFNFSAAGSATVTIRRYGFWLQQSALEPANDNIMPLEKTA